MKTLRKNRNFKSRYIGYVDDYVRYSLPFYGRSPAIDCLRSLGKLPYYFESPKVYSDEIQLPDDAWCMNRSCEYLLRQQPSDRMYAAATAWVNLACKLQAIKNSFKKH